MKTRKQVQARSDYMISMIADEIKKTTKALDEIDPNEFDSDALSRALVAVATYQNAGHFMPNFLQRTVEKETALVLVKFYAKTVKEG